MNFDEKIKKSELALKRAGLYMTIEVALGASIKFLSPTIANPAFATIVPISIVMFIVGAYMMLSIIDSYDN